MDVETLAYFRRMVDDSGGPDACWPWKEHREAGGYGVLIVWGKWRKASRFALELALGRPLGAAFACHHCDNPPCCNPAHLYEGNAQTNRDDCVRRGRAGPIAAGVLASWERLSTEQRTARALKGHASRTPEQQQERARKAAATRRARKVQRAP